MLLKDNLEAVQYCFMEDPAELVHNVVLHKRHKK